MLDDTGQAGQRAGRWQRMTNKDTLCFEFLDGDEASDAFRLLSKGSVGCVIGLEARMTSRPIEAHPAYRERRRTWWGGHKPSMEDMRAMGQGLDEYMCPVWCVTVQQADKVTQRAGERI